MIINHQNIQVETTHYTCPYHEEHPEDHDYAGCTCSSTYTSFVSPEFQEKMPLPGSKPFNQTTLLDTVKNIFKG
jgi:hypothetical protein